MSTRLQIDFCGIKLENPCLLASAPPTQSREGIAKALRMGWAGAVTKTCAPDDLITADTANRFAVLRSADGSITGLKVIDSSGYAVLDDYSIESEEMIKQKIKPRLYDLLYVFGAVNPGTRDFEEYFDRLFLYVKNYHNTMMQYVFGEK